MRERTDGASLADYQYTLDHIEISPDGSSASVDARAINLIPGIRTTSRTRHAGAAALANAGGTQ